VPPHPSRWRLAAILVLLALPIAAPLRAQAGAAATSKPALVAEFLRVTRVAETALSAMEAQLPAQRALNPKVSPEFWDRFLARVRRDTAAMLTELVPIYEEAFTVEQLRDLLAFYRTPSGRRFIEVQPELAHASVLAGQRWGARVGADVGADMLEAGIPLTTE
jgi:hypothetical protein